MGGALEDRSALSPFGFLGENLRITAHSIAQLETRPQLGVEFLRIGDAHAAIDIKGRRGNYPHTGLGT